MIRSFAIDVTDVQKGRVFASITGLVSTREGTNEDDARAAMESALKGELSNLLANHLGESIQARALGLEMETYGALPGRLVTEDQLIQAAEKISIKAKALARAIKEHDSDGLALPYFLHPSAAKFLADLNKLCIAERTIQSLSQSTRSRRGPKTKGGREAWLVWCLITAWEATVREPISYSERSRFVGAARIVFERFGLQTDNFSAFLKRTAGKLDQSYNV